MGTRCTTRRSIGRTYQVLWREGWYAKDSRTSITLSRFTYMSSPYLAHPTWTFIHISEFQKLKSEFTLKNLKKVKAIRMWQVWVNQKFLKSGKPNKSYMPDTIECFKVSKSPQWIQIPPGKRSFIPFESHYDNQVIEHPPLKRTLYGYQEKTITDAIEQSVWLIHADTGSWKTSMICWLTSRLKRNTLIMVQNLTQMKQMVDDIHKIFGIIPTQVSGKKPSKKEQSTWYEHITVCSIDSRDKVNPEDYWLILLDEADTYLGSDDRRAWIGSLSPEYMYALTWTIQVNDVEQKVFDIHYGKVTRLAMLNHTPNYTQVLSSFNFQIDDVNTQFHELKSALYESPTRNKLIVDLVAEKISGRKWLVFCEHVEHAKTLKQMLDAKGIRTYLMIGEVKDDERERIRDEVRAYKGDCVIIGSVKIIWRGFDIPELSLAVLTTCEKFQSSIQQYVWRLARFHEWKPHAVFYDIVDNLQPILNRQSISRIRTYRATYKEGKTFIKT